VTPRPPGGPRALTRRERQILRLTVRGFSSQQIAGALFLTEDTVRKHRAKLYGALGLRAQEGKRSQLAEMQRAALQQGYLDECPTCRTQVKVQAAGEPELRNPPVVVEVVMYRGPALSPQQASVLRDLAQGKTVKMIQQERDWTYTTATGAVAAVRKKLGANTQAHALAIAYASGILELETGKKNVQDS
jgi:DNA-binding NarL/FixJ family response regulator